MRLYQPKPSLPQPDENSDCRPLAPFGEQTIPRGHNTSLSFNDRVAVLTHLIDAFTKVTDRKERQKPLKARGYLALLPGVTKTGISSWPQTAALEI
ncbi:MAG: hypothetical protein ACJAVI_005244 [Candidatus Azotimanducaceae bacterium]|jgi:hypothetical protein